MIAFYLQKKKYQKLRYESLNDQAIASEQTKGGIAIGCMLLLCCLPYVCIVLYGGKGSKGPYGLSHIGIRLEREIIYTTFSATCSENAGAEYVENMIRDREVAATMAANAADAARANGTSEKTKTSSISITTSSGTVTSDVDNIFGRIAALSWEPPEMEEVVIEIDTALEEWRRTTNATDDHEVVGGFGQDLVEETENGDDDDGNYMMRFRSMAAGEYTISEGGTVATKVKAGYRGAICDGQSTEGGGAPDYYNSDAIEEGKHHVQFEVATDSGYGAGGWCFGVCRPGIDLNDAASQDFYNRDDTWMMYQNNAPQWWLECNSNKGNIDTDSIDRKLNAGDRVGLLLDLDNGGTLTLYLDGEPCGTIAEGLAGPLHWCITSFSPGMAVRIHAGLGIPSH